MQHEEVQDAAMWERFQEAGLLDQASLEKKGSGSTRQRISKVKAELSVTRILEKIASEELAIQEDLSNTNSTRLLFNWRRRLVKRQDCRRFTKDVKDRKLTCISRHDNLQ